MTLSPFSPLEMSTATPDFGCCSSPTRVKPMVFGSVEVVILLPVGVVLADFQQVVDDAAVHGRIAADTVVIPVKDAGVAVLHEQDQRVGGKAWTQSLTADCRELPHWESWLSTKVTARVVGWFWTSVPSRILVRS